MSTPPDRPPDSNACARQAARSSLAANDRIRQMMRDLDAPLDAVPRQADPRLDRHFRKAREAHDLAVKKQRANELKRARQAARRAFGTRPSLSSRRAATALLTAGAVGVAAFTGPKLATGPRAYAPAVHLSHGYGDQRMPAALIRASGTFKQALIEEEGVRYVVYRDVAGYPTVGVGHLVDPGDGLRVGDRVSRAQVLDFLERDLIEAEQGVRQLVGDLPLHQHEFDALLDLVYNVGLGNVSARESPRLNAAIEAGDYDRIASELDYTHAAGRVARGLQFRSERRAQIFLDGEYEDPRDTA